MSRIFECGVLLRVFILVLCLLYSFTSFEHPESAIYKVAHADSFTLAAMGFLGLAASLGFIDLFINDLLPARFVLCRALEYRHLVNMALALCFAIQLWSDIRYDLPDSVIPFYSVYVIFIPLSAIADVRKRFKNKVVL